MAMEAICLVNIMGKISSLDNALNKIVQSEMLHIEHIEKDSKLNDFENIDEKSPYSDTFGKINKILQLLDITPKFNDYSSIDSKSLNEINGLISQIFEKISKNTEQISNLKTKISLMEKSLDQLQHMKMMNSNIYKIFSAKFIKTYFGRITIDNCLKLSYFNNENFFFIPTEQDQTFCWGFLIAPQHEKENLKKIIDSLYFESYYSSQSNEDSPDISVNKIKSKINELKTNLEGLNSEIEKYKSEYNHILISIYSKIKTLHKTFLYRKYAVTNNKLFYMNGFVLKKNVDDFVNLFDETDDVIVETDFNNRKKLASPVELKTCSLFRPFELLVKTFGVPSAKGTNPTSFIGLIYCFLFGLMFGDVGQGLFLFLVGIIVWKTKKNMLGLVLTRCGVSSSLFGLIYDSCFGFEGIFEKIWPKIGILKNLPFNLLKGNNAVTILIISLILGMILTITSILINIFINLKNKNFKDAILSSNGIVGLTIYGGLTASAISIIIFKLNILNPIFIILTFFLPVMLIFLQKPISDFIEIKFFNKKVERNFDILNAFLETFETILNYFTNTLSFLRVGGFAMSHAALMLVVIKFCEKCSNIVASPLIAVFGNVFVIALEGFVVSIQVLRLVYYEIFSRFYKADGKLFSPAKIEF